jgi:hypothetical protein
MTRQPVFVPVVVDMVDLKAPNVRASTRSAAHPAVAVPSVLCEDLGLDLLEAQDVGIEVGHLPFAPGNLVLFRVSRTPTTSFLGLAFLALRLETVLVRLVSVKWPSPATLQASLGNDTINGARNTFLLGGVEKHEFSL